MTYEDPPWPELPDPNAAPADLSDTRHTFEIVAGIFIGSALAAAAVYYLMA